MANGAQPTRTVAFLKLLFIIHLILSSWGMSSASPFSSAPISYVYYNIIFMASIIWAISSKTGLEAPALALLTTVSTTVLDIIELSLYWPTATVKAKVFLGLAIANTVARPLTGLLLYQLFRERDTEGVGFSGIFTEVTAPLAAAGATGASRAGYQGIGGNTQPAPPPARSSAAAPPTTPAGRGYQAV